MNEIDNGTLETLCRVIADCSAAVPMPEWPPYIIEADSYLHKEYFRHLFILLKKTLRKGIKYNDIGKVLLPSRVTQIMHSIYGLHQSELSHEERILLLLTLLGIISSRRSDPFCLGGKNLLMSKKKSLELYQNCPIKFKDCRKSQEWDKMSRIVGGTNALLFSYCDLIHVCQHASSHEFQGPYHIDDEKIFIVREYYDLRPVEVWPFVNHFPIDYFCTLEVYQGVDVRFSFFNHLIPNSALPPKVIGIYASVEPMSDAFKTLEYDRLKLTLNDMRSFMLKLNRLTRSMKKSDWIQKYVEMHYYSLKPLADLTESEWRPSQSQYKNLKKTPDLAAASAFHALAGLDNQEKRRVLEDLYRGFIFR